MMEIRIHSSRSWALKEIHYGETGHQSTPVAEQPLQTDINQEDVTTFRRQLTWHGKVETLWENQTTAQ